MHSWYRPRDVMRSRNPFVNFLCAFHVSPTMLKMCRRGELASSLCKLEGLHETVISMGKIILVLTVSSHAQDNFWLSKILLDVEFSFLEKKKKTKVAENKKQVLMPMNGILLSGTEKHHWIRHRYYCHSRVLPSAW